MRSKSLKLKLISVLICMAIIFSTLSFVAMPKANAQTTEVKEWNVASIEEVLNRAFASYIKNGKHTNGTGYMDSDEFLASASSTDTDWTAFSIARFGKLNADGNYEYLYKDGEGTEKTLAKYGEALKKYFLSKYDAGDLLHRAKATEWHRGAMAYLATNNDPTSIPYTDTTKGTFDLIADGSYNCLTKDPGKQGINGWIWGLLSMDYLESEVPEGVMFTREDFIKEIIKRQIFNLETLEYEGFSLSSYSSDGDITGMALTALAPYYNDDTLYTYKNTNSNETRTVTVRQIYDEAVKILPRLMMPSGAVVSWSNANVESTSWAMLPIIGIGIDPVKDSRFFSSDNRSYIDGIMNFEISDGGFCHTYAAGDEGYNNGGGSWNSMGNDQATYALVGYWRFLNGERALFDMRPEFTEAEKVSIAKAKADIDNALALKGREGYQEAINSALSSYNAVKADKNQRYVYNYYKLSDALKELSKPSGVKLLSNPDKLVYAVGENFDTKGMSFAEVYPHGAMTKLSNPEITVVDNKPFAVAGKNTPVKVQVNGSEFVVNVEVTPEILGQTAFSVEAFSVYSSFVVEPNLYTIYKGDTIKDVIENAVLKAGFGVKYNADGVLSAIYNGAIKGEGIISPTEKTSQFRIKATPVYPKVLSDLMKETGYDKNITEPSHGTSGSGKYAVLTGFGEGDFTKAGCWMIRLNEKIIPVTEYKTLYNQPVNDGDVIRLQYSILDKGGELGTGLFEKTNAEGVKEKVLLNMIKTDAFIKKFATLVNHGTKYAYGMNQKISPVTRILAKLNGTQEEFDTALNALNGVKEVVRVSFNPSSVKYQDVEYGKTAVKPETDPVKTDAKYAYKFMGWYIGSKEFDWSTPIYSKVTIKARFVQDGLRKFTVKFLSDDTILSELLIEYGNSATAPADPTKTGYTFAGWDKTFDNITKDTTVNAKWTINQYTVTFKNDNEVIDTQKVDYNTGATAPKVPIKTGYTFVGWDKAFDKVTEDITVNAKWTITKYTVTFKNGDEVISTSKVNHNTGATAPADPTKTGYTFAGWDKAFDNITEDTTVNAKWTINQYTVTFKNDNEVIDTQKVDYNTGATAPADPTKTGYTFAGWDKAFDKVTEDITVNAKWTINQYTVTFKDGETVLATVKADYNTGATAPVAPEKDGYKFIKWDKTFDKVTSDITVNAIYEETSGCSSAVNAVDISIAVVLVGLAFIVIARKRKLSK